MKGEALSCGTIHLTTVSGTIDVVFSLKPQFMRQLLKALLQALRLVKERKYSFLHAYGISALTLPNSRVTYSSHENRKCSLLLFRHFCQDLGFLFLPWGGRVSAISPQIHPVYVLDEEGELCTRHIQISLTWDGGWLGRAL